MSSMPSETSTSDAFKLSAALARLGLAQYEERLRENGFENWETVTAITEDDMAELDFKRGDRRKLHRAIREYNSTNAFQGGYWNSHFPLSSGGPSSVGEHSEATTPSSQQQATRTIRSYRRHPRPDPNAPHKPKTAYVLFGEHVRQDPALIHSSFTEFAKETGKRWRNLSHEERVNSWEAPAADRLRKYKEELECYKQTKEYRSYQTYIDDFKHQIQHPGSILPPKNESLPTHAVESSRELSTRHEAPQAANQESVNPDNLCFESESQGMALPANDEIDEVRQISRALGVNSRFTSSGAFPSEDITTQAVEAFVYGTGSLLYLWDRDEAFELVRNVYRPQGDSKPTHAMEVFAMAAVGSYCDAEARAMLLRENFLHLFLNMLSSSLDMHDLRRMRLFACLAICRFTNSVESARRLMCK
jgi:hypothetical protein